MSIRFSVVAECLQQFGVDNSAQIYFKNGNILRLKTVSAKAFLRLKESRKPSVADACYKRKGSAS